MSAAQPHRVRDATGAAEKKPRKSGRLADTIAAFLSVLPRTRGEETAFRAKIVEDRIQWRGILRKSIPRWREKLMSRVNLTTWQRRRLRRPFAETRAAGLVRREPPGSGRP